MGIGQMLIVLHERVPEKKVYVTGCDLKKFGIFLYKTKFKKNLAIPLQKSFI